MMLTFRLGAGPVLLIRCPSLKIFFCVVSLVTLKAFKGEAELCTLRFAGVFSGLACFDFNRTDCSAHSKKITASKQSVHFGNLNRNECLICINVKATLN